MTITEISLLEVLYMKMLYSLQVCVSSSQRRKQIQGGTCYLSGRWEAPLSLSPLLPLAPLSLHAMPLVVVGIAGHCCSGLRAIVARLRLTMCWEAPAPLWVSALHACHCPAILSTTTNTSVLTTCFNSSIPTQATLCCWHSSLKYGMKSFGLSLLCS